jgi:hypothetical protein
MRTVTVTQYSLWWRGSGNISARGKALSQCDKVTEASKQQFRQEQSRLPQVKLHAAVGQGKCGPICTILGKHPSLIQIILHEILPVIHTSYAVTNPEGNLASGRAEDPKSFSQKIYRQCKFFVKKDKSVPCCRRRSRLSRQSVSHLNTCRVTRVIQRNWF